MRQGDLPSDAVLRDYHKLSEENRSKAGKYIKKLLQIQRAEQRLSAEVHSVEWKRRADERQGIHCSFCGKYQDDAEHIIAGPNEIYICDECARLCGDVLDEAEANEMKEESE